MFLKCNVASKRVNRSLVEIGTRGYACNE